MNAPSPAETNEINMTVTISELDDNGASDPVVQRSLSFVAQAPQIIQEPKGRQNAKADKNFDRVVKDPIGPVGR